jgi:hypothetical protein
MVNRTGTGARALPVGANYRRRVATLSGIAQNSTYIGDDRKAHAVVLVAAGEKVVELHYDLRTGEKVHAGR